MISDLKKIRIDKNIRILITGCAGFIGSNLTEFFLKKGAIVRGVDNLSTGFKKNIDDLISEVSKEKTDIDFNFIKGDIRKYDDCLKSTRDIDIIFHLAALGSVQRSIENPLASNQTNISGTLNLLEASRKNGIKRFIYASSSSIYGDSEILPKDEKMTPNPKSIYAVTKLTAEYYCRLFHKLYGLKTISLRYFNVFGKRQNPDSVYSAVIPRFIKNISLDVPPVVYGDGTQSRDFTHIENVIYANYLAAYSDNKNIFGNYYNVACNKKISLNEIIKILSDYFNKKISVVFEEERKGDIKHSLASIKKIRKDIAYHPVVGFDKGLMKLLEQPIE